MLLPLQIRGHRPGPVQKKVVSRFTQAITGRLTRDCGKSDFSTDRNNGLSCSSLAHLPQSQGVEYTKNAHKTIESALWVELKERASETTPH